MHTPLRRLAGFSPHPSLTASPKAHSSVMRSLAMLAMIGGLSGEANAIEKTKTVPGTANIYGAGHSEPPVAGFGGSGTLPPSVSFSAGTGQTLQIVATTGSVTLDKVTNNAGIGPCGPDGGPFYSPTDVTSIGALSGIKSNVTGFLTGVFLDGNEPTGAGPAVLDFNPAGKGTNFTTLSPEIGQVFFIGDGRTESKKIQQFKVPPTATRLFLGVVDAADGDNAAGPPQAYDDNGGEFKATVRIEPKITKIIYNHSGDLFLMNADGSNKQNLTSGSYYTDQGELSADGKFIAFRGSQAAPAPNGTTLFGLWVMKAEAVSPSNLPIRVSPNLNYGYNISWHPDGQYVAVGEYVTSSPLVAILRVRNDGGDITPESASNPAVRMTFQSNDFYYFGANFSPDGQYLAMSNKGKQIFLLRAFNNAGEPTPESATNSIIKVGTLDPDRQAGTPEWSPDAMSVVFPQIAPAATPENYTSRIAVLKVRNSSGNVTPENAANPRVNYTPTTPGDKTTLSPSWSADGKYIAFASAPDNVSYYNTYTILASRPEDNSTNPRIPLTTDADRGTLIPSFAPARKLIDLPPAKFKLELTGLQNGQLLPPKTDVSLRARFTPSEIPGVTITRVQFYLNGDAKGSPDTTEPYTYSSTVVSAGKRVITAVATDSLGRTATSPPLSFTVTPAGAGQIALETDVSPDKENVAPGQLITYRLRATNTSKSAVAKDVKIVVPIPDDTKYDDSEAFDENGNKISPRPKVSDNKKEVVFNLGNIPVGKMRRAILTVRVPYDARAGGDPIENDHFTITGTGFGDQPFSGNFEVVPRKIVGASPKNSPRLGMVKAIVDLPDDKNDELDMLEDPKLGPIPGAGPGDVLTFLLVVSNYGGLPAEKLSIKDRVPAGCKLVPKSVRVNGVSAGALLEVDGRTLNFQLGDLKANEFVVVQYQLAILERADGGPLPDSIIYSVGADVGSMSLRSRPNSSPERLPIKIENPVALVANHEAVPGRSVPGTTTTYTLTYRNEGNRIARNAKITNPIPDGTDYKKGTAVIKGNKPEEKVAFPDPRTLVFNLGDIPPEGSGQVSFKVDVRARALEMKKLEVVNRPYFGSPVSSAAPALHSSLSPATAPLPLFDPFPEDRNPLVGPKIPRMCIARISPQSVQKGDPFTYQIIVGNMSDVRVGGAGGVVFEIPAGAEYKSSSLGSLITTKGKQFYIAPWHQIAKTDDGKFPTHAARAITILLKATGDAGKVIKDPTCHITVQGALETYVPTAATLITEGPVTLDNRGAIAGAQLEALGFDSYMALLDDRVAKSIRNINDDSVSIRIGGASYVQFTNGSTLIPLLGKDQIIAIGAEALIGNDGSTLVGNDGSTMVAAGGGNLITFNGLIGNDGSTLVGQDGSTIMSKIRNGDAKNLVALGAGNMVAAGGGNLVGNDGASLVGNDGASLATIASFLTSKGGNMVAAGGGNILGPDGFGVIAADFAKVIINDSEALVAAGGGNMVAAGGGNRSGKGITVTSRDASWAHAIGKDGTITVGGGGSPMVAAGGGN